MRVNTIMLTQVNVPASLREPRRIGQTRRMRIGVRCMHFCFAQKQFCASYSAVGELRRGAHSLLPATHPHRIFYRPFFSSLNFIFLHPNSLGCDKDWNREKGRSQQGGSTSPHK